jgi:hypothetical protein
MAAVMALQNGWGDSTSTVAESLDFKGECHLRVPQLAMPYHKCQVNNDIHGLVASVNDGSTSAFMWEWFTTKPWKDRGEVRFVRIQAGMMYFKVSEILQPRLALCPHLGLHG